MSDVLQRLEQARLDSRSWLYRWLYTRYDELSPVLNRARAPWMALTITIQGDDEWTADKPPSRQAVRDTWLRIAKEKAAQTRERPANKAKPSATTASRYAVPAPPTRPFQPPPEDEDFDLPAIQKPLR